MTNKKKEKKTSNRLLMLKKAALLIYLLGLTFLPGQSECLTRQLRWQPVAVQASEVNLPPPADYPVVLENHTLPVLSANSALVMDVGSGVILWAKNPYLRLLPASTVKMMTALVTLDYYQPEAVVTVNNVNWDGQDIELIRGERLTVLSLLYGLLVASANDAALVLADNYPGGKGAFITAMNQKARELNLIDTYYVNPTGMNDDHEGNLLLDLSFTTSSDLARLAVQLIQNPLLSQIVATPEIVVRDVSGQKTHHLYNVNQLLGKVEGLKGVKTGWTENAGECLVSLVERNGHQIIVVVLGSQDRFGETVDLVEWVFGNTRWENIIPLTG